ncbi:histidine kinase [Anaeromyxobacter dehalogenans]|nr:histidine kinase [Anaeromyxobacter dehalogenans]
MPERRPSALVLHPDVSIRAELGWALGARDMASVSAADGASGLALLLEELLALDALVVKLDLPGRDARAFADLVRRAGGEQELAIVVLASDPSPSLRDELAALGVDEVVDPRLGPGTVADAVIAAVWRRRSGAGAGTRAPRSQRRLRETEGLDTFSTAA